MGPRIVPVCFFVGAIQMHAHANAGAFEAEVLPALRKCGLACGNPEFPSGALNLTALVLADGVALDREDCGTERRLNGSPLGIAGASAQITPPKTVYFELAPPKSGGPNQEEK